MSHRYTRRRFLGQSAAVAAAAWARPLAAHALAPSERVNVAAVGVGGKGWTDVNGAAPFANIVAFCDVAKDPADRRGGYGAAAEAWPQARRYTDWREMLDKEHQNLDGITVSTPDHMHAPISMTAIQLGLATYTQKPMTRTILEARRVAQAAHKAGVATQMGNQHHNGGTYRTLVELIQSGAVGKIREAHAWSDRPIWPQGIDRPKGKSPVPESLDWDLWLGVASKRPFKEDVYHPFKWRGWFDFGAGALGDMGCHIIDPVVWALELGAASSVQYEGPAPKPETFPAWEILRYEFAGTKYTTGRTLRMTWYDGKKQPPRELAGLAEGQKYPSNGTLFVGEKGAIVTSHGSGGTPQLLPADKYRDFELPTLPTVNHYGQWASAIRGEGKTTSNFDYAGPLTETVLLGTVAARFPDQRLEWNLHELKFSNFSAANEYIHQPYRRGWEVAGIS